jgi:hypothetical protein
VSGGLPSAFRRALDQQTTSVPAAAKETLGKIIALGKQIGFFPLLPSKLFLLSTYNMWYSMLKFGIFLDIFAIFN